MTPVVGIARAIEAARPHNMAAAAGCVFSAYFLAGGRDAGAAAWPLVMTALVTGLGNLVNDYFDADIDRVNKPRRPIPSGRLSAALVWRVYWAGTALATAAAPLLLGPAMAALALCWEALLFVYAWRAKRTALAGNVLVGSIAASAFFGGASLAGNAGAAAFPAALAFVLVMARELIKDAEDVTGDRAAGARTLAVRFGEEPVVLWAAMLLFACVTASPVPALWGRYSRTYALLMELVFVPGLLAAAWTALRSPDRRALNRAAWVLKVDMFFGILAISLG